MRSPLWIANSILILFFLAIILFVSFSLKKVFSPIDVPCLAPSKVITLPKEERPKNVKFIEDNDLFGTYKIQIEAPDIIKIPDIPKPPSVKPIPDIKEAKVQFLEPLDIKISGIISSPDENKSQVTLVDTKSNESKSYKIGDKLLDAYILRIFPRKITVIRSNGQQDTIFMYKEDAEGEIKELKGMSWADVVEKLSDTDFLIDKDNFIKKVTNLAELIDMLDLTTAFKNGVSVGCQIGNMDERSIGNSLGLYKGDIILSIDNIPPNNTENRLLIYKKFDLAKNQDIIKLEILRKNKKVNYNYHIKIEEKKIKEKKLALNKKKEKETEIIKTLNRNQSSSLASNRLKLKDKYAMSRHGNKDALIKESKLS